MFVEVARGPLDKVGIRQLRGNDNFKLRGDPVGAALQSTL